MQILSFDDVDSALKRVAELSVAIERINGEVTLACNEIKEKRASEIKALSDELKYIEQVITNFCEDNKAAFAEKRSKDFVYGTVGYKISTSVSLPRDKNKIESLLKAIKSYGLSDTCINYEEKPNKEGLCELDEASLVKLGLKKVVKDNFRIVPNIENLEIKA